MARRRIFLIVNPTSGRGRAEQMLPALSSALQRRGFVAEVFQTSGPGEARAAAERAAEDTWALLSVGGDGTLNEVVSGNVERKLPVAVLPLGTANLLARELALPWHVPELAEALVDAEPRWIDLLRVRSRDADGQPQERICVAVASAGMDADVVEDFAAQRTGAIHFLQYAGPTARHFMRFAPKPLTIEVDGNRVAGDGDGVSNVLVANCRHYSGPFVIARDADPSDGQVEVCLFRPSGRLALLALASRMFSNALREGQDYDIVRGSRIRITGTPGQPLQVDGDPGGYLPVEMELMPRAVPILGAS